MVIIRLIYINNKPNPEEYTKEIPRKHDNNNQSVSKNQDIKKKIDLNHNQKTVSPSKLNETTETSLIKISNFRQFVDLFYSKKEASFLL